MKNGSTILCGENHGEDRKCFWSVMYKAHLQYTSYLSHTDILIRKPIRRTSGSIRNFHLEEFKETSYFDPDKYDIECYIKKYLEMIRSLLIRNDISLIRRKKLLFWMTEVGRAYVFDRFKCCIFRCFDKHKSYIKRI